MNINKLEEILREVEKPGRYIGGEWNEIKKDPAQVKLKIALVFPDIYEIGMSYLGQKILYHLLNQHPFFLAERVFAPWFDFAQQLRVKNIPLYSLENKIPLGNFDLIGFSLLYELNYTNILSILDLGHIPLFSKERGLNYPLVIAGGPAAFNPEPIADVFDLFLIGDGEEAFLEIAEKFEKLKKEVKDKMSLLKEMASIKGVYVPCLYSPYQPSDSFLLAVKTKGKALPKIKKRIVSSFSKSPFPERIIVPNLKVIFDRVAVEVERGCPQKCRFCQASTIYFPPRERSPKNVISSLLNSLQLTGYEDASLTSLSVGDYPFLEKVVKVLMECLEREKISLSLSSLRPMCLSSEISQSIVKVRKTGFTVVPEAGTERLRTVINKRLDDNEIWEAAKITFSSGWKLLKLYFMVGLPTEEEEDLKGIVKIVKEIIKIGYQILKSAPQINLSIASFIPKPHTPFQWLKMEDEKNLREKHRYIKLQLRKYPFVRFKEHSINSSILEAVFSRGDRRLNQVLYQAWKQGAGFDSWKDCFRFQTWTKAFALEELDYHLYLQALDQDQILPWDHIDPGIKKSWLWRELQEALKGKATDPCLKRSCRECQGCSYPFYWKKTRPKEVDIQPQIYSYFGQETRKIIGYRVYYEKKEMARFLSHRDLINILQRSLRRARIQFIHSKGFHPKMAVSYLPALPLGMAGKEEVFEFKSNHNMAAAGFLKQVNNVLPSGIKFLKIERVKESEPSLSKQIEGFVYSLDLNNKEIKKAIQKLEKQGFDSWPQKLEFLRQLLKEFLQKSNRALLSKVSLDFQKNKLFLRLPYSAQPGLRPQEILANVLDIKNSVFFMTREKVLFKKESVAKNCKHYQNSNE